MREGGTGTLPTGWVEANIGDLVGHAGIFCDGDWVESKDQDPAGDVRLVQLADVGDGHYRDKSSRFLTSAKARGLGCTFIQPGDILIARMPDPLGRACIFPGDQKPSITVVDVCVVRLASPVTGRWLMHQLNTPHLRQLVASAQSGSTRRRISRTNLAKIRFPLPPLPEQERIASVVDELLSDLDAGVAALERVRVKLALYRASVLKAAVDGTLTAEWRAQHPNSEPASTLLDRILVERRRRWEEEQIAKFKAKGQEPPKNWKAKYKEPVVPDTTDLAALPDGWCWATVDQLSQQVRNGYSLKPDASAGVPILRISAVRSFALDLNDVRFLSGEPTDYVDSLIQPGDLLFTRYNGTRSLVGVCAVVPAIDRKIVHPDKLIRARPVRALDSPAFIALAANVGGSRAFIERRIRTTAGQAGVSGGDVKALPVPFPRRAEQEVIVETVEDQLSVIDHVEADVEAKLKSAQSLRQAILRHAFTGQLVPQDPNDEPASELLKRIAAEREARAHEAATARPGSKRAAGTRRRRTSETQRPPSPALE